jgi:hypothetical protein
MRNRRMRRRRRRNRMRRRNWIRRRILNEVKVTVVTIVMVVGQNCLTERRDNSDNSNLQNQKGIVRETREA